MPRSVRRSEAKNPIAALFGDQKARKQRLAEQAAQKITDDMAGNEQKMLDLLDSINFNKSPIPREELDRKTHPSQPCGDLEYGTKAAIYNIKKHSMAVRADLRPIDEKLLILAAYLQQSVEYGNPCAAYAAKAALLRGLTEIRERVPKVTTALIPRFIEQNVKYLDEWITLVELAEGMDGMKVVTEQQKAEYNAAKVAYDQSMEAFKKSLEQDPEKVKALEELDRSTTKEANETWSATAKDLQQELIAQELKRSLINVKEALYRSSEKQQQMLSYNVDMLNSKLNSLKPTMDPNAFAKYEEAIDDMVKELNKSDVELKNMLDAVVKVDGQIRQLTENGEGNARYRTMARKALNKTMKELQENERKQMEQATAPGGYLHKLGLHSEEEIKAEVERLRQEREMEEQQVVDEIMNENGNEQLFN